jgi:hypothetical protein
MSAVTRSDVFNAWQRFVGTAIASGIPLDPMRLPVLIADALVLLEPIHEDPESAEAIAEELTIAHAADLFRELEPENAEQCRPELTILRERYDAAESRVQRSGRLYERAARASECADTESEAHEHADTAAMLRGPFHAALLERDAARAAYLGAGGVL